jgi:hypothetical protein
MFSGSRLSLLVVLLALTCTAVWADGSTCDVQQSCPPGGPAGDGSPPDEDPDPCSCLPPIDPPPFPGPGVCVVPPGEVVCRSVE